MNVDIGTEAALFPEKEYINGIFFAVQTPSNVRELVAQCSQRHSYFYNNFPEMTSFYTHKEVRNDTCHAYTDYGNATELILTL
jgi:hypothetical protein